ncbi:phosphoglycerate mutase 2-like [Bacillus rossius redtenbacheri]|uniref:phosphoglycerate mutase 2-like n=1 Tax=Bacillus rossius redtenbacheri TaxID=93214 RepID=UPI002FDEB844
MATHTVVMVRNGSCEWNERNLIPSWSDTTLSEAGKQCSRRAGQALKKAGHRFDVAFTSVMARAQESLHIMLEELGQPGLPVEMSWRLNDRHYGALTGLNRAELSAAYGAEQVRLWHYSYDVAPPPMTARHPQHRAIVGGAAYADGPSAAEFPAAESLRMTVERTLPYWTDVIVPRVRSGARVLVCAHGDSLRGLAKHLGGISDHAISRLNIPMCIPFVYQLNANMEAVAPMRYLASEDVLMDAMEAIEAQTRV